MSFQHLWREEPVIHQVGTTQHGKCFRGFGILANKCSLHSMPSRFFLRESSLINSIPGGQRLGHCSAMLIGLSGVLTEAKKDPPPQKVVSCQAGAIPSVPEARLLESKEAQRAISSKPCPPPPPAFLERFILSKTVIIVSPNLTRVAFTVLNT